MTHGAQKDSYTEKSSVCFCTCNEGFGGKDALLRLNAHIANPDPNSLSALLIKAMS